MKQLQPLQIKQIILYLFTINKPVVGPVEGTDVSRPLPQMQCIKNPKSDIAIAIHFWFILIPLWLAKKVPYIYLAI